MDDAQILEMFRPLFADLLEGDSFPAKSAPPALSRFELAAAELSALGIVIARLRPCGPRSVSRNAARA